NVAQDHDNAVDRARRIPVRAHAIDQLRNCVGLDLIERERAKFRKNVDTKHSLIGLPAVFVSAHIRQVLLMYEPAKLRYRPHFSALLLRIRAEQGLSNNLFSLAARLIQSQDLGWPNLVLSLAAVLVSVPLIIGLAARLSDFQQKSTL